METPFNYLQPMLLILPLFTIILIMHLVTKNFNQYNSKTKTIPKPPGSLPIIGHLHLLGGDGTTLARTFGAMSDKCGPIFALKLGQHNAIVMSSWEFVKECFSNNNDMIIATRPMMALSKYLAYDFASFSISPYGRYWREIRKISTVELLSNKRLEKMKHVRAFEVNSCLECFYEKCVQVEKNNECGRVKICLKKWFEYLGFNIALCMVVGKRYYPALYEENGSLASRFKKAIEGATHLAGLPIPSDFLPWIEWMDLGGFIRDMKMTHEEIDVIIGHWLDEHIEKRKDTLERGGMSIDEADDFMDVMLSNITEPFAMSTYSKETIIKATALTLLLTGSESTSITLTWAVSLLVNSPETLKLAQEEMDEQVGKQRWVEESDITNLPYLQAIVKETLRLYPPSPLTGPREAQENCQINGHCITKGTRLIVNIWKLHRDPSVWLDPDQFRPERFIEENKDVDFRGQHFGYIPFSLGRRGCPGMNFGLQVVYLMLARLVQGFSIWAENGGPIDMKEGLGLALPKVSPLDVILAPRLSTKLYEAL